MMNKLKYSKVLFFLLFQLSVCYSQKILTQLEGIIKLELSTIKKVYVKGEFITGDVVVRNLQSQTIFIPSIHQLTGDIHFRGEDGGGKWLEPSGFIFEGPDDTMHLAPHSERSEQVSIDYALGNDKPSPGVQEFKIGKYRVWATLGDVMSNHIEFEVIELPDTEKKIYEAINKTLIYLPPREERVNLCKNLIRSYPKSTLLPNVYNQLFGALTYMKKSAEIMQTALKFIEKYPDAPYSKTVVYHYARALEQKGKMQDEVTEGTRKNVLRSLQKLHDKAKSTRLQRSVKEVIITTLREWNRIENNSHERR